MTPNRDHADDPRDHFTDAHVRLRFWTGGSLRDEIWLDAADPAANDLAWRVHEYHAGLAHLADAAGVRWLVEVYDPTAPADQAFYSYGTDVRATEQPTAPPPRRPDDSGPLARLDADAERRFR